MVLEITLFTYVLRDSWSTLKTTFLRQNALWAVVISRQVLGSFPVWSPAGAQPDQGQNLRNMGRNSEFRNSGLPTPGNLGTEMGPTGTGVWVRLVSPYGVQYRPI